ncbi:hypothetical protein ACJX0J_031254, partial [Zea mays]
HVYSLCLHFLVSGIHFPEMNLNFLLNALVGLITLFISAVGYYIFYYWIYLNSGTEYEFEEIYKRAAALKTPQ